MKISKELFETIYPELEYICITYPHKAIQYYKDGRYSEMEINDFFFKCKEYARDIGYELRSWNNYCACIEYKDGYGINQKDFQADSEQQAVFDATEWVINYLKGKDEKKQQKQSKKTLQNISK